MAHLCDVMLRIINTQRQVAAQQFTSLNFEADHFFENVRMLQCWLEIQYSAVLLVTYIYKKGS
jgi:hypothetical protein